MTKPELSEALYLNHAQLNKYVDALDEEQFNFSYNGKWTAGQQISHIILCLQPINQALASKEFIAKRFGMIDRQVLKSDQVIDIYKAALDDNGKAPVRYVPDSVDVSQRATLSEKLESILQSINEQLSNYSDDELDTLVLPHPLLGKLTIREMIYLMTYHATHHHKQTEQNLSNFQ